MAYEYGKPSPLGALRASWPGTKTRPENIGDMLNFPTRGGPAHPDSFSSFPHIPELGTARLSPDLHSQPLPSHHNRATWPYRCPRSRVNGHSNSPTHPFLILLRLPIILSLSILVAAVIRKLRQSNRAEPVMTPSLRASHANFCRSAARTGTVPCRTHCHFWSH